MVPLLEDNTSHDRRLIGPEILDLPGDAPPGVAQVLTPTDSIVALLRAHRLGGDMF